MAPPKKPTADSADVSCDIESELKQITTGIAEMQAFVKQLAFEVREIKTKQEQAAENRKVSVEPAVENVSTRQSASVLPSTMSANVDRSYIANFKELGGNNLMFYPNTKMHPMLFLKKLNKMFCDAGVPDDNKVGLAISCLRGIAADWALIKEDLFSCYRDFETAFIDKFWGVEKQRNLVLELNYGQFEGNCRADYFLNLVSQARFLSQPLPTGKLIDMLVKHFPVEIQRGIITNGLHSIDEVESFLRKIDETFESSQVDSRPRYRPPGNRGNVSGSTNARSRDEERATGADQTRGSGNVRHIFFQRDSSDLLTDSDSEPEDNNVVSPVMIGKFGSRNIEILLDSGSDICAISESFYEELRAEHSETSIPLLPVTNVSIAVAVGGNKQRIKRQISLPIEIGGLKMDVACLVVPKLNSNLLFGSNWMFKYRVRLDFEKSLLHFRENSNEYACEISFKISENDFQINLCHAGPTSSDFSPQIGTKSDQIRHSYSDAQLKSAAQDAETGIENQKALYEILKRNQTVFSESPGRVLGYEHAIELNTYEAFNAPTYPIPFKYRCEVDAQVEEMLSSGIIKLEKSEHISPLVCVTKKDKSVRVCLDARTLNSKMKKDFVAPPNPNDLLINFKEGQILSTIDLTAAYWQIPIRTGDTTYIGFIHNGESYTFQRLPFGLSTSMASLIRCLNRVLGPECTNFSCIYVDDLLVFSENIPAHFEHLNIIFSKLRKAGMTVKLRKSQFIRKEVTFLGHIVSQKGIKIDPTRINSIVNYPIPRNIKELRAFLGLINYEHRFCPNFSRQIEPLLSLLRKNRSWSWKTEQQAAFESVKHSFLDNVFLAHPNFDLTFFLQADSSNFAVGGYLYQMSKQGEKRVIAYASSVLKGSQLNYTTTEKELFAILYCLRQWRTLILGRDLVIRSDHKALSFLLTCKLKTARLTRWTLFIQEYDFRIEYCKGPENVIADTLSRYPPKSQILARPIQAKNVNISVLKLFGDFQTLKKELRSLVEDQKKENWIKTRLDFLTKFSLEVKVVTSKELSICQWFTVHEGLLFKKGNRESPDYKLCVPQERVTSLVLKHHTSMGHFGKSKLFLYMRQLFYWPKMQKQIRQLVASCDLCQKAKSSPSCHGNLNPILVEEPGKLVCLDLVGPLPEGRGKVTQLLVVVDAFSKYVSLYPLRRATTRTILNKLRECYFVEVQKPQTILSDNGTQFSSNKWKTELNELGVKVAFTSVYFPQGNITERYNKEVIRLLRSYCFEKHTKWPNVLNFVKDCLNNSINLNTGFSPALLQTGREIENPLLRLIKFPECEREPKSMRELWKVAYETLSSRARKRIKKDSAKEKPIFLNQAMLS